MATWWTSLPTDDRERILQIPSVARYLQDASAANLSESDALSPSLRDALIRALFDAQSELTMLPIQDVFGWHDRINTPARIDEENWTWRMPWPVDRLDEIREARARAEALASWIREAGR